MKMIHIEKPVPELRNEIVKIWPYGQFELWDNGDIIIKAESISRWDGCWYFFIMTEFCHIHLTVPVNMCARIRKVMWNE